jgi:hypothetical protein
LEYKGRDQTEAYGGQRYTRQRLLWVRTRDEREAFGGQRERTTDVKRTEGETRQRLLEDRIRDRTEDWGLGCFHRRKHQGTVRRLPNETNRDHPIRHWTVGRNDFNNSMIRLLEKV